MSGPSPTGPDRPSEPREGGDPGPRAKGFAPSREWVRDQRDIHRYAGAGLQFGLSIALFTLLGYWLDGRFGTRPWLLLAGVLVGFGGGAISLFKKFSHP